MLSYRITKYNPSFREYNDVYNLKEWTSFWDIGKSFNGKVLTISEYLVVENAYVNAVLAFMKDLNITSLKVKDVEIYGKLPKLNKTSITYSNDMINLGSSLDRVGKQMFQQ